MQFALQTKIDQQNHQIKMQIIQTEKPDPVDQRITELVEYYFNSEGFAYFQIQVEIKAKALKEILISIDTEQFVYPPINHSHFDNSYQEQISFNNPLSFRQYSYQQFEPDIAKNYSLFESLIGQRVLQHHYQDPNIKPKPILNPTQANTKSDIKKSIPQVFKPVTFKKQKQVLKMNNTQILQVGNLSVRFIQKGCQTLERILTQSKVKQKDPHLKSQLNITIPTTQNFIEEDIIVNQTKKKSIRKKKRKTLFDTKKVKKSKYSGRQPTFKGMEAELKKLIQLAFQQKRHINRNVIRKKALQILERRKIKTDFKASRGWIQKYLRRNPELAEKVKILNEVASLDDLSLKDYKKSTSPSVKKKFTRSKAETKTQ